MDCCTWNGRSNFSKRFLVYKQKQFPACTRPALPLRCFAFAWEIQASTMLDIPWEVTAAFEWGNTMKNKQINSPKWVKQREEERLETKTTAGLYADTGYTSQIRFQTVAHDAFGKIRPIVGETVHTRRGLKRFSLCFPPSITWTTSSIVMLVSAMLVARTTWHRLRSTF